MKMSKTESERVIAISEDRQATIPKEFREELGVESSGWVTFVKEDRKIVVRPVRSATDLRGVLEGSSDRLGRSALERLQTERAMDADSEQELRQRYAGVDENEDERRGEASGTTATSSLLSESSPISTKVYQTADSTSQ